MKRVRIMSMRSKRGLSSATQTACSSSSFSRSTFERKLVPALRALPLAGRTIQ